MKKCTLCVAVLLSILVFNTAKAQARVCVFCASNLSEQPSWGPAGYDFVYYYYMPEIETYYYVPDHQFIYQRQGTWVFSGTLPLRYAVFDFYKACKIVINDPEPYLQHESHKAYYATVKGPRNQPVNRDSEEYRQAKHKEAIGNHTGKENASGLRADGL